MDLTKTKACQEIIGYRFCDPTLLWEALQAKGSYTCAMLDEQATNSRYKAGNRRLAIVGDEVMNVLLSEKWYRSYESLRKSRLDCGCFINYLITLTKNRRRIYEA